VQLVGCVGQGRYGALHMLRRGLLPTLLAQVPVSLVHGLWALHHKPPEVRGCRLPPAPRCAYPSPALLLQRPCPP
jgi:hypothetical protein